jgi:3-hydroxyacyl-CoA dehydrogenase
MKKLHRTGRYREAMRELLEAKGPEADLLRKVILGYVAYALNRVGEVVREPADVDRIMGYGFNWAPPTVLVDLLGAAETIRGIESIGLAVPPVLKEQARKPGERMFRDPNVDVGRFFVG